MPCASIGQMGFRAKHGRCHMSHPFIDRIGDAEGGAPEEGELSTDLLPHPDVARKYLAFVSHELNNNLGGVLLLLHVLRKQFAADCVDRAAVADMLDTASQVIQDTVSATRRFLHVERARHAAGRPDSEPVRLFELARRMTLQFAAEAEMKGLTLANDVPANATVVSNRELILLVLQNLVGNAVKFSDSGTVRIGADVDPATGATSALWVSDQGPGIAGGQLTHIFTAFGRAATCGATGVGLGLTVAAEAARLLGARLKVESRPGRGTTFYLAFNHNGHDTAPTSPP